MVFERSATQKFVSDNKETILKTANVLQEGGKGITETSTGLAVAGLAFEGIGAAPGLAGMALGGVATLTGDLLEGTTNLIVGNTEAGAGKLVETLIEKVIDEIANAAVPGPNPKLSTAVKEVMKVRNEYLKTTISETTKDVIKK